MWVPCHGRSPTMTDVTAVWPFGHGVHTGQRIAVLWQSMSGYFNACLKALSSAAGARIALAYEAARPMAPFDAAQFEWVDTAYRWSGSPDAAQVRRLVSSLEPDAVLVSSWHINPYRTVLHELRGRGIPRVLCMDNQWLGTPKQWLGRMTWRLYIRPCYDLAFIPGDRQARFARLLGFRSEHLMRGLYCADTEAFLAPRSDGEARDKAFLYVGRLVPEKGISVLATAYQWYRRAVTDPWPLRVAGTGPELGRLSGVDGVELLGFVQPGDLPAVMRRAAVAVCPSLFEPWGVVIHEAAAAGMVIVCSEAVGAGPHLVQDGYNGYVVPTGQAADLSRAMIALTSMSDERRQGMSAASESLGRQFTPQRWALYVSDMLAWHQLLSGERIARR